MTLLAAELILPESSVELAGDALLHSLWDGRYRVLAYVTSFLFIANFWVGTLMILRHLRRFDGRMWWIVLVHMLLIAFIPYPTSVIGQHPNDQVAQVFYFATLTATALFLALLWGYASARRRLVDVDISQKVVVELHRNSIAATALFLVLTGLSVVGIGRIVSGLSLGYVVAAVSILMAVVVNVGDDAESEKPLPDSEVETGGIGGGSARRAPPENPCTPGPPSGGPRAASARSARCARSACARPSFENVTVGDESRSASPSRPHREGDHAMDEIAPDSRRGAVIADCRPA